MTTVRRLMRKLVDYSVNKLRVTRSRDRFAYLFARYIDITIITIDWQQHRHHSSVKFSTSHVAFTVAQRLGKE